MKVLITGATGFIGRALIEKLRYEDVGEIRAAVRSPHNVLPKDVVVHAVGNLSGQTNWHSALSGVDVVIHTAAHVHVMGRNPSAAETEFFRVNVEATLKLARQAVMAGVQRFIFISSVKVLGEGSQNGRIYKADDLPNPADPYASSKMEAEEGLTALARETGLEITILRPPLVYGPGAKANFLNLMKLIDLKIPLPFKGVDNRRSLVFVGNLVDAIVKCMLHPEAAGRSFLLSDGQDLSTPDLIRGLASAMGRPTRLFWVPDALLAATAKLPGPFRSVSKLTESLAVDSNPIRAKLAWSPPYTVEEGIQRTVECYLARARRG